MISSTRELKQKSLNFTVTYSHYIYLHTSGNINRLLFFLRSEDIAPSHVTVRFFFFQPWNLLTYTATTKSVPEHRKIIETGVYFSFPKLNICNGIPYDTNLEIRQEFYLREKNSTYMNLLVSSYTGFETWMYQYRCRYKILEHCIVDKK